MLEADVVEAEQSTNLPDSVRRILVVENRQSWRDIHSEVFGSIDGVVVETAGSYQGAERLLAEGTYDLVLTDLHMYEGGKDEESYHGDKVVAHVIENYPDTQVGIVSGSISKKARTRLLNEEYGVFFITKDDVRKRPDFARSKVSAFLEHEPHYYSAADKAKIDELVKDCLDLDNIGAIYSAIDGLQADLHVIVKNIKTADMPEDKRAEILKLVAGDADAVLSHSIDGDAIYDDGPRRAASKFHEYKGEFQLAVDKVGEMSGEYTHLTGLHRHMSDTLTGMISTLESATGTEKLTVKQIWEREVTRMKELYPDVDFSISEGQSEDSEHPKKFSVPQQLRETFRILLSNAAQAYDGYEGAKLVEMEVQDWGDNELALSFYNGGSPLPESLRKTLSKEDVETTKGYGSGFGLKRAVEIGEEFGYHLKLGYGEQTEASIVLGPDSYEMVPLVDTQEQRSRLLVIDHARRYDYLQSAEDDIGFPVDYFVREKEFAEIADDPAQANAYAGLILHPSSEFIEIAERMQKNNTSLRIFVVSGVDPFIEEAETRLEHCGTSKGMPPESALYVVFKGAGR